MINPKDKYSIIAALYCWFFDHDYETYHLDVRICQNCGKVENS